MLERRSTLQCFLLPTRWGNWETEVCGVDIGQTPRDFLFFGEPLSANRSSAGSSMVNPSCEARVCKARLPLVCRRGQLLAAEFPIWGSCEKRALLQQPVLPRSGEGGSTGRFRIAPSCFSTLPSSSPQSAPIIMEAGCSSQ